MKKWIWSLVVVAVALSLISPALAREGGMRRKGRMGKGCDFWKSEKMVEKLGLTEAQVAELSETDYQNRKAKIEVDARLEAARLELEHLLAGDTVSQAETSALVDKIADARRDQTKLKLEKMIKVRSVLSAEQWKKLEECKKKFTRKMKGKRSGKEDYHKGEGRGPGKCSADKESS